MPQSRFEPAIPAAADLRLRRATTGICLHPSTMFTIGHGCTITHMYLTDNVKGKWRCRSVPSTLTIRAEGPARVMLSPRQCKATRVTLLSSSEIGMKGQHVCNRSAIVAEMAQSITAVLLLIDKPPFRKESRCLPSVRILFKWDNKRGKWG